MNKYFLTTERLGFSHWREDNFENAKSLWGDSIVTKYIKAGESFTDEEIKEKLKREVENQELYAVQYWPVFNLEDGGFVGCCGFRPYGKEKNILELGFHLKSEHWGKGYGTESAKAVIDYAFNKMNICALFAGHHPNNGNSSKLLLKLGFLPVGEEYYPPTGLKHPGYILLRGSSKLVDEYIFEQKEELRPVLQKIRLAIRLAAPEATEKISWQMPTFWQGKNLIHFAAFKKHIGIYPGGEASALFAERLEGYKTSKGTIQLPLDKPIDYDLLSDITKWRVESAAGKKLK